MVHIVETDNNNMIVIRAKAHPMNLDTCQIGSAGNWVYVDVIPFTSTPIAPPRTRRVHILYRPGPHRRGQPVPLTTTHTIDISTCTAAPKMSSILPDTTKPATLLSKRFRPEQIPDLSGRVVIVTGGSAGIGFHDALALALAGATVLIISANEEKGKQAEAEINKQLKEVSSYGSVTWHGLNLGDLKKVDELAQKLSKELDRLDIFIANAGIGQAPYGLTEDGIERHFEVSR